MREPSSLRANGANVKATFYGEELPRPEILISESDARGLLADWVGQARRMASRFPGQCDLTDGQIQGGAEIYFLRRDEDGKMVLLAEAIDEILQ